MKVIHPLLQTSDMPDELEHSCGGTTKDKGELNEKQSWMGNLLAAWSLPCVSCSTEEKRKELEHWATTFLNLYQFPM